MVAAHCVPNWISILSTDTAVEGAFYKELFGWGEEPDPIGNFLTHHGKPVASIHSIDPAEGMSRRTICIGVPDCDFSTARAASLGATIYVEPVDVGTFRVSTLSDLGGALFAIWTPFEGRVVSVASDHPVHGDLVWYEVMAAYREQTRARYEQVFDWSSEIVEGGSGPHVIFRSGDQTIAGAFQQPMEGVPPTWYAYFEVDVIEAVIAEVTRLGGVAATGVITAPGVGQIAYARDPTGGEFALMQSGLHPS